MDDDKSLVVVVLLAIIIAISITCASFYPASEETMSVRSMSWKRTIKELEDYQTYECHTRTRTDANGNTKTERNCGYETHTRTINTWIEKGTWPQKPYWTAGYIIGSGHYERRYENYYIVFSDDKKLYTYSTWQEKEYNRFEPRQNRVVILNIFRTVAGVK